MKAHIFKERGGCAGGGKGYLGSDELTFTLSTNQDQSVMTIQEEPKAFGLQSVMIGRKPENGGNGLGVKEEEAPTLTKADRHAVCYDTTQATSPQNGSNPQAGDPCHPISKTAHAPLLISRIFQQNQRDEVRFVGDSGEGDVAGALKTQEGMHNQNFLMVEGDKSFLQNQVGEVFTSDVTHTLNTNANATGRNAPNIIQGNDRTALPILYGFDSLSSNSMKSKNPHSGVHIDSVTKTLDTTFPCPSKNQGGNAVLFEPALPQQSEVMVRRLTPMECERLQGFPDGYTDIPVYEIRKGVKRYKPAPDSARYSALGNSMTVQVMRWIGERIQLVEDELRDIEMMS